MNVCVYGKMRVFMNVRACDSRLQMWIQWKEQSVCAFGVPMFLYTSADLLSKSLFLDRVGALYKGFLPKVVRLGPGGGILLVVFDFISKLLA